MPSELSRKLDDFRTKQKVVPTTQKVSFLFEPSRAAGLDILSLAIIARKSLLALAESEESLVLFEDLFVGTDKSVEFLSQTEHAELQGRIKRLLSFLSGHMKTLDAQQCVEYLIQKYRIHVYNGEDLILLALPHHDTAMFGKLVQLIPFFKKIERATASESRWMFLSNVHKTGSPLSRQTLVKMCRSSQPVMTAIMDYVIDSLKFGAYNESLLSFANVLLLEVLSDFSQIKFNISIPLFSLCRACFKASQHCISAFFVALSLSVHIVCVAEVREDALGILFSRAVSVCPPGKAHALLSGLNMVAKRQEGLPRSVVEALEKMKDEELDSALNSCRSTSNLAALREAVKDSAVLSHRFIPVDLPCPQISGTVPLEKTDVEDSHQSESSSSEEEEEDQLEIARKELNALIKKGSTEERKRAILKHASLSGTGRLCIRLAALCGCIESLRFTMKNLKNDAGFVPVLVSVLAQFSENPHVVFEAIFAEMHRVPEGALLEVATALGIPHAAAIMAVSKKKESEFFLSPEVWKAVAVAAAGSSQLSRTSPLQEWKNACMQIANVKEFCDGFIQMADRQPVGVKMPISERIETLHGQFMCSMTIPSSKTRKALLQLVVKNMSELSDSVRSDFVAVLLSHGNSQIFKKLNEMERLGTLKATDGLTKGIEKILSEFNSADGWILTKSLIESIGATNSTTAFSSHVFFSALRNSSACKTSALKCVSALISASSGLTVEEAVELVEILIGMCENVKGEDETQALMDTLLTLLSKSDASKMDKNIVKSLVAQLVNTCILSQEQASDTLILSMQSVCELVLSAIEFDSAWTLLLEIVSDSPQQDKEALKVRCFVLLASVLAREDVDSETVTSKQLGQVILALSDLVVVSPSDASQTDSWANLSEDSPAQFSFVIEKCISQFLLHCTLRKLDKMFRRLVSMTGDDRDIKQALMLRVYATVCEQGGSAATLALLPLASDSILLALKNRESKSASKRKRNASLLLAALRAVTASCVEEIPESQVSEFIDAVSEIPGKIDDASVVAETCIALARVGSADQIKSFTKQLMQRTTDASMPEIQEGVVKTILAMWKSVGESMVPAITEVTVFLNALYHASDADVRRVSKQLVSEIDRVTGEDIAGKLGGGSEDEDIS